MIVLCDQARHDHLVRERVVHGVGFLGRGLLELVERTDADHTVSPHRNGLRTGPGRIQGDDFPRTVDHEAARRGPGLCRLCNVLPQRRLGTSDLCTKRRSDDRQRSPHTAHDRFHGVLSIFFCRLPEDQECIVATARRSSSTIGLPRA
jgi:hypothetical protein